MQTHICNAPFENPEYESLLVKCSVMYFTCIFHFLVFGTDHLVFLGKVTVQFSLNEFAISIEVVLCTHREVLYAKNNLATIHTYTDNGILYSQKMVFCDPCQFLISLHEQLAKCRFTESKGKIQE